MADPGKCTVRLTFQEPTHALSDAAEKSVHLDQIGERWVSLVEKINAGKRPGTSLPSHVIPDEIRGIGRDLAALFPEITERLSATQANFLILEIDARLVHLPWELLYDVGSGRFLCERFSMGRLPHTTDQEVRVGERRKLDRPFDMWILAEPGADLAGAASEARDLCGYIDEMMNADEEIIHADTDIGGIGPGEVRERIKDYDFVHFAGHADHYAEHPGQGGWRLIDGHFTPSDIEGIRGVRAMPALVFSNACQSARTGKWEKKEKHAPGESFGLANAFMLAGVRHYLGTSWELRDEPGKDFALCFYEHLLSGKTVGDAVRLARLGLRGESGGNDMSWASYVLYGDPMTNYFGNREDRDNWIKLQITVIRSEGGDTRSSSGKKHPPVFAWPRLLAAGSLLLLGFMGMMLADLHSTRSPNQPPVAEPEQIRAFQESIRDRKKQIGELWEKYLRLSVPPKPLISSDDWTSVPLTLAFVLESQRAFSDQETERLISLAIQSELSHHDTGFTLLHRKSFDLVLEELIRGIEAGLLRPGRLKMPGYLLFIALDPSEKTPLVRMELVDLETRQSLDFLMEPLEADPSVLAQKKRLSQKLLEVLKALGKKPIRGIISEVSGKSAILNVGTDHGVQIGQRFQLVGQDAVLEVRSLKGGGRSCMVVVKEGEIQPGKNWRVEQK